ncbi:MAG: radical SAM protein [Candidatus Bathyarchaeota archaeon]|nr:radical SAM protein [Candidatus Bathyarchaeota archaeon]
MPVTYKQMKVNTVLGNVGILPTRLWTRHCFDPYANCEFNCVYCDSGFHTPQGCKEKPNTVFVKYNAPEVLAHELSYVKTRGVLSLGVATDIYQPAEEKFQITRQLLEVLRDYKCPFALGTKSALILRDLDIISEAAKNSWCCASLSIATLDEKVAKLLEPNASPPQKRLEAVKKLSDAGVMVGVWAAPLLPYITDTNENIERVVEAAVENGAKFVLGVSTDSRNPVRFKAFMDQHFPQFVSKYERLYSGVERSGGLQTYYPDESYLYDLYKRFILICEKYGVQHYIPHFHTRRQAWLFFMRNFGQFKGSPHFELTQLLNYLSPSKEMLQTVRIRCGRGAVTENFLKVLGYFPH